MFGQAADVLGDTLDLLVPTFIEAMESINDYRLRRGMEQLFEEVVS
jgi:hypothetical protein